MKPEFKDYYATLGVPRQAGDEEIKKAFRRLAREYHPDVAKDKKRAEERFKEINEAYEVLGDPQKRARYDELADAWSSGVPFESSPRGGRRRTSRRSKSSSQPDFHFDGTGLSDFFEHFFGPHGERGGSTEESELFGFDTEGGAPPSSHGADVEGDLLVSLEEALRGSIRTIALEQVDPNTGRRESTEFKVRIPPGVREGQSIRVPGKGDTGMGGGPPGDLFLRVHLGAHPNFRPQGADLVHDLELAPWDAVLGATVEVPTLEGPIRLRVPAGTIAGQRLRVRGRGLPTGSTGERGDLLVAIAVQLPTQVSAPERELWERLRALATTAPRGG